MQLHNVVSGKDIYLRTLRVSDVSSSYLSWLNDPEINQFLEVRFNPPRTLKELRTFIKNCSQSNSTLLFGIFLWDFDRHIGNVKLGPVNAHHKTADLGFLIGDITLWGNGYASQAITLTCNFGFRKLGLEKITAGAAAHNKGSQKALLNAGFTLEGVLRSQSVFGCTRQDVCLYGRLNTYDHFEY